MSTASGALARTGIGCGVATGAFVISVALMIAGTLIATWTSPAGTRGIGEVTGFLLVPFFPAAAVAGLVAAFSPRIGLVIAALVVACAVALGVMLQFA